VQLAVDGEAARALADLARARWQRATGESLVALEPHVAPWPEALVPDVRDCTLAIARTEPPYEGEPGVREVQSLWLESIARARTSIYIESQYFTAPCVTEALCARLAEREGPEVVLVLPARCSGWIEESTMGRLRIELVRALRAADRFGRLAVLAPWLEGDRPLNVHSKLCVIDDSLARIGSANLSGRSMGFDSECDVALESDGRLDVRSAIAGLRARLLGEHTGLGAAVFEERRARFRGSLLRAIPRGRAGKRGLRDIEDCEGLSAGSWMRSVPIDPDRALAIASRRNITLGFVLALAAVSVSAALWRR
jgi:phospholipase D1/2